MTALQTTFRTLSCTQYTHQAIGFGATLHPSSAHLTVTTTIGHTLRAIADHELSITITHWHNENEPVSHTTINAANTHTLARLVTNHIDSILTTLASNQGKDWDELIEVTGDMEEAGIGTWELVEALIGTFDADDLDKLARTALWNAEVEA